MNTYKYTVIPISDFPRIEDSKKITKRGNFLYEVPPNIEVKALNPETGKVEWVHPKTFSVHPNVDIYLVQFDDGDFVFMGKNHSLIVYKDEGFTDIATKDGKGYFCIANENENITEQNSVIAKGMMGARGMKGIRGKGYVEKSFELKLNYNTGLFIGLVLGDGWVDINDILYLAGSTKEKLLNRKLFAKLCNSKDLPYENGVKEIDRVSKNIVGKYTSRGKTKVSCAWFNRWFREQIGSGAFNKKIPAFSLNGPKEHLMGILDGLISTDGSISAIDISHINFTIFSSSIELMNGLKVLSKRLNLKYSIYPYRSSISDKLNYRFRLQSGTFKKFVKETDFKISHTLKQENLLKAMTLIEGLEKKESKLPVPSIILQKEILGNHSKIDIYRYEMIKAFKSGGIDREMIQKINDGCGSDLIHKEEWLRYLSIINKNFTWKRIKDVKQITPYTAFDLELPRFGNFFVSGCGCCTCNSDGDNVNIHIPATEEAKKEVLEKMMPSKNLISPKSFQPTLVPSNESALGLYNLSTENNPTTNLKKFKTEDDAFKAYQSGELAAGEKIEIEG